MNKISSLAALLILAITTYASAATASAPTITTARALPNGQVGTAYSTTLSASGGSPPYSWKVTASAPPAGLTLNSASGVISGTPKSAVAPTFMVTVTDANSATEAATFSLRVNSASAAPLSITTASQLPGGTVNSAYSTTLAATGGSTPYRWQVTAGSLPAGLTLNSASGVISGTPKSAGAPSFTVTVTDTNSATSAATFSLRVNSASAAPLSITTPSQLPNGSVNSAYSTTLAATGGVTPYRWQVTAGSLPAGLALNATSGVISGTPSSAGAANPTITVTDANSTTSAATFSLRVNSASAAPLSITTPSQLPSGSVNSAYSTTLAATGGSAPYRWQVTASAPPAGLTLNSTSGVISGTPTSAVAPTFRVSVTDASSATVEATFSLRVNSASAAPVSITTASQLPGGSVNSAYSTTLAATGGATPYRWQVTAGSLPAGLSLNATSGVISGTPSNAGTANPTITVTDSSSATANATFSLQVNSTSTPVAITTGSKLPDGVIGSAYSATLAASGGAAPYRWQVTAGSLPGGLTLNATSGVISGTPSSVGTANPTITVTDANSMSTSGNFSLAINSAGTGWQLTWSDEFDGTTLDSSKWLNPTNDNSCNGYTQQSVAADDSYLDGSGHLVVRAQSRASGGCGSMHLTAGQISTKGHFSQAYGKFEFRAQMPAGGGGIWPALWLYPIGVSWPPEIDVLEDISDMSTVYMTYHWGSDNQQSSSTYANSALATGFHTYSVEWEPNLITWYIDGNAVRSFSGSNVSNTPMGILIDIYLGGWAGSVTASFPQYMLVDYVRVYSRQ